MKRCLASVVAERASWKVPSEGRRWAYSPAPWTKALSRWMCGWVSEGSRRGNALGCWNDDWEEVMEEMVPCGDEGG